MKNPPAFPVVGMSQIGQQPVTAVFDSGMSLRDYFAANVIQGICASNSSSNWTNSRLAAEAYDMADAMLKARDATT